MPQIGPAEILVILLVGLLVFGPHRLPEIGRQVGKGMRELRKFQDTVKGELDEVLNLHETDEATPAASAALPAPASGDPGSDGPAPSNEARSEVSDAPGAAPAEPGARAPSRFRPPGSPSSA